MDGYITFDATRVDDNRHHLSAIAGEVTHVFWVAIQVRDSEEANVTVNTTMLENVLNVLKSDPGSSLAHINLQTRTQHYMGPFNDPAHSDQLIPHNPPFSKDMARLPYPNFYYALEDLVASYAPSVMYSIHRPSIILGASSTSVYNTLLTAAAYAAICRHEELRFRFPGTRYTWEHFCDSSDARVIAE